MTTSDRLAALLHEADCKPNHLYCDGQRCEDIAARLIAAGVTPPQPSDLAAALSDDRAWTSGYVAGRAAALRARGVTVSAPGNVADAARAVVAAFRSSLLMHDVNYEAVAGAIWDLSTALSRSTALRTPTPEKENTMPETGSVSEYALQTEAEISSVAIDRLNALYEGEHSADHLCDHPAIEAEAVAALRTPALDVERLATAFARMNLGPSGEPNDADREWAADFARAYAVPDGRPRSR